MKQQNRPIANPGLVLREEFDDWAVLFDPDTGDGFGMNPAAVFVWKLLDGYHTESQITEALRDAYNEVPEDVDSHVREFIDDLVRRGFVGFEVESSAST
ncbi:MAG: SynChlorMet cassette protein ScmD [Desulfomonile tiedjei]|uniref:SynChlorMet cassette protein ScmD n=1 Tax=Desulfomonile tiedjei TaxID=2358 RepID=A0A9D6V9P1_9BACT|nr:SynChlorMet cassette protein ScmD [Desulfomonile tiedjei]